MYSGYTTTTLTLRAKGSFSYKHPSLYNDRVESCRWDCIPSSDFSIHGFPINPRFLYGYCLRQSTLIQWSPSRSFLSGGAAAGARYYRLGLRDRRPSPSKDPGRCGRSWTYRRARDPDGSYREMIGLLADIKCCYQESIGIGRDSERSGLGRSGRISEGEVRIKSVDGERSRSSRGEDVRGMRKDVSNSSYYSSPSKGDMCRRVAGEYRNGYSKYGCGVNSVDTAEKEVKEVREYGGGARSERRYDSRQDVGWDSRDEIKLRENDGSTRGSSSKNVSGWEIRDKKEKDAFLMDHVHEARERYIREEQRNVGQRDSRGGSQNLICEDNTNRASTSKNVVDARKRASEGSSATFVKRRSEIDQRAVGSTESRSSQKLNEITEIHGSNIRRDSDSKRRFEETRLKDRVDASSSVQNIVAARDKRFQMEAESNQQDKNIINVSQIHGSDTGKLSSSQIHVETRTDDREHDSNSAVDLVRRAREQHNQISEHANHQSSSRRATERNTKSSELSRSEIKGVSNSQEKLHEDNSTSVINRVRGSREEQNKANEYSSRRASERDTKSSEFSSSKDERVSNSQGISITRIENQKQTSSTLLVQNKKDKQKSILTGENSQSDKAQREFSEISDDSRDETYQSKDDKLESARRLDKSSALYVGEFVDRLNQEISASVELDTTSNRQTTTDVHLGVIDAATSSINETHTQESARQSSSRSGAKGPSDEMWDVRGTYSQEPSRTEEHEEDSPAMGVEDSTTAPARTENSITLRRHKSLWTYIADIVRMGWVLRAESRKHKSSSNESVSSEAWFSGHEHDENDDETDKGRSSAPKGPVDLTHQRTPAVPSQGSSEASRPVGMITLTEASSSTSTGSIKRNPSSKSASSVSEPVEFLWTEEEKARQGIPSSVVIVDQPSALTGGTVSQTTVDQSLTEASSSTSTGSIQRNPPSKGASSVSEPVEFQWTEGEKGRQGFPSNVVTVDQSSAFTGGTVSLTIEEEITEVGRTEGKDGELKRRKLQRNKQVLKEQFDEWEEAYKLESEQRKMDEFFMREALLEAKKAGDTWEVPVGAVLVQNGKIIARGYNLVEALRDSTAHAEMICIREASNLLRTWRLAETTLYVTLEPCAMCAGAILQARIETLVWGAPNKLLGADGSWVRLFPGEDRGSNSLDPSGQRPGPVHPFHPKMTIRRGILPTECSDVMQEFFQLRRRKKTVPPPPPPPLPPPPSCLPISTHPAKLVTKMHDIFCMMFCL